MGKLDHRSNGVEPVAGDRPASEIEDFLPVD
jgi:hypothetical protein